MGAGNSSSSMSKLAQAVHELDANVIFMRHALAPGFGDPDNFAVIDCLAQRNLNDEGLTQASSRAAAN